MQAPECACESPARIVSPRADRRIRQDEAPGTRSVRLPLNYWFHFERRDVRVVEGARLESVCRGNLTVGSNPTLSASSTFMTRLLGLVAACFSVAVMAAGPAAESIAL